MVVQSMDLKDFPPFAAAQDKSACGRMADYLKGLLNSAGLSEQLMFLPSTSTLSQFFKLSPLEIHETLEALTAQGYRYLYMGPESPITFCRQQPGNPQPLPG